MNTASRSIIGFTWALVALFVVLLAIVGPTIDDHSAEQDQALALQDAIKAEQAQERFAKAARDLCGENGAWRLIDARTVQCMTHRGAKTIVVKVAS